MKIKNLHINKDKIKMIGSCTLVAAITCGLFKVAGLGYPFIIDKEKYQEYHKTNFDNLGNYSVDTVYGNYESVIIHYGKWNISEKGHYKRDYKVYKLNNLDIEDANDLLRNPNIINKKLGQAQVSGEEVKGGLISTEELEKEEYIEAFIYSKKENNYIIVKEPIYDNFMMTLIYIMTNCICDLYPVYFYHRKKVREKESF